jgi:hypothetical protein
MRHPISKTIGGVLAAATLALTLSAFAQEPAVPPPPADPQQPSQPAQPPAPPSPEPINVRAVRITDVEGKVQVLNGSDTAFNQAVPNMPVIEGMRFVTGDDGRLEIQFEDGSVARVTPNSSITLVQLHRLGDGTTVTVVDANAGLTYYELNGRAGQYTVRFGPNSVTPTDSAIFRINLDGNPADLAVTHGIVHLSDGQSINLDVRTSHSVHFDTQNIGQYELVQSVAADTWDQWNSDRDQALATLEESATTARAGTGNPDDAAWNDLDYYGDWYNVPGYGMAWSPSGVGSGWDPYGSGYWGYYSTFGYTWISANPWGWWPYRCGAWNWFNTFGWMWFPGNCGFAGVGWYPYAGIWRKPPYYRFPVRPKGDPVHSHPPGGPLGGSHQNLIAVNGSQPFDQQQFRTLGASRPTPRFFDYDGHSIAPAEATLRPRTAGPIGEGFTATAARTYPDLIHNTVHVAPPGRMGYVPGSSSGGSAPAPIYRPAPSPGNSTRAPYSAGGGGGGGGHVSAPPPPASGGHPR